MELKYRKRIINKYYGGKVVPDQAGDRDIVNPAGHPKFLTLTGLPYMTLWNDSILQKPVLQQTRPALQTWADLLVYDLQQNPPKSEIKVDAGSDTRTEINTPGILVSGMNFVGDVLNDFNSYKKSDELIGDAGYRLSNINGVAYQRLNDINQQLLYDELSTVNTANTVKTIGSGASLGGTIGGAFGPLGGLIGTIGGGLVGGIVGLFGGAHNKNKLRKLIYNAQQLVNRTNRYNRSGAFSTGLQRDYYNNNIDTSGGVLYANKGKDLKQPKYGRN